MIEIFAREIFAMELRDASGLFIRLDAFSNLIWLIEYYCEC